MPPEEIERYGREVDRRLREVLGDRLEGSWFVGSVALGGYRPGTSDVDIAALCSAALDDEQVARIGSRLSHAELPCPARGLELVVHRSGPGEGGDEEPDLRVALNLNTGAGVEERLDVDGAGVPAFWFVIDRAVAHRSGITISGPPAADAFADPPRSDVLAAMIQSVRWHRASAAAVGDAVLNAARAWRYAVTGALGPKLEGAEWARSRSRHSEVVAAAEGLGHEARLGSQPHEVDGFLDEVETELRLALA